MADLTITVAQVLKGTDAVVDYTHLAGATITAGQNLYLDSTTNTWKLTDANAVGTAAIDGISLHGSLAGQPIAVQTSGDITLGAGAAMTVGETYGNSDNAGGIAPISDKSTGDYVSLAGVAISASVLRMARLNTGIAHA